MKILILGHGGHGKDEAAKILSNLYGFTYQSSSRAALDAIWPALKEATPCKDKERAFQWRGNDRALWKALISLYNTPDKSALVTKVIKQCDMYIGLRCQEEYAASQHLFDLILWIDASKRFPEIDPSMSIEFNEKEMIKIEEYCKMRQKKTWRP